MFASRSRRRLPRVRRGTTPRTLRRRRRRRRLTPAAHNDRISRTVSLSQYLHSSQSFSYRGRRSCPDNSVNFFRSVVDVPRRPPRVFVHRLPFPRPLAKRFFFFATRKPGHGYLPAHTSVDGLKNIPTEILFLV